MRSRRWILLGTVVAAFGGAYALKRSSPRPPESRNSPPPAAARVVSLAPSTTEMVFALGLGDRLVGVTRYCDYPPEARTKPRIGGYYDPNYEALVHARPDLILTLPEHENVRQEIRKLGLKALALNHGTVRGILESVRTLGEAFGVSDRATQLRLDLESRIERVKTRTAGRPRPRVLVSVGRMAGDENMTRITACGRGGLYDELIELAGGVNAFERDISFPAISPEGILAARPGVIIDMFPDLKEKGIDEEAVRRQWRSIPGLTARIHIVGESYAVVPGPRFVLLLEEMSRAIHPEVVRD